MDNLSWIPWVISFVLLLFSAATYFRNGKKDSDESIRKEEAKFDGIKESLLKANMKLDQVCATTNETRSDIKSLNKDMQNIETRVSLVERDIKTCFKKLDELKGE